MKEYPIDICLLILRMLQLAVTSVMATTSEYDSDNKVQKLRRLLTTEGSSAWELAW